MSDASSSSGSRSSSPEPILDKRSKKIKEKTKTKASTNGKEEGTDPTWPFRPPEGMSLLEDLGGEVEEFDWDILKEDKDLELWLIRVPEGVKPKYLDNLSLKIPSSSSKTTRAGVLPRKHTTFDVWHVGDSAADREESSVAGGDEIKNISCLLPRKSKKGHMRVASRPIARHLVVSAQPVTPSKFSTDSHNSDPAVTKQNPPRFTYPKERLKHRYVAYGSTSEARVRNMTDGAEANEDAMDVDAEGGEPAVAAPVSKKKDLSSPKKKGAPSSPSKSKEGKTSKAKRKELEDADTETPKAKKAKKSKS
ncbi:hypothetical protein D9758_012937 [Tetrapyrgos nigripes]|uniref:Uncharacterized protein n=1 Tax=Tetrapyrgos nigripes TaxID=182062 RepID=A0A8H5FNC5_9AGAR|nr:hypothetical protein D9758_012937 [Tetrapyrgos nigripes]